MRLGSVCYIERERASARARHCLGLTLAAWRGQPQEKLNGVVPAAILLDLMMPEMDGFEFMDALRLRGNGKAIPVIVITAKDLTEADHRRLNGGVERIIQKGATSPAEVLDLVRSVMQNCAGQDI